MIRGAGIQSPDSCTLTTAPFLLCRKNIVNGDKESVVAGEGSLAARTLTRSLPFRIGKSRDPHAGNP